MNEVALVRRHRMTEGWLATRKKKSINFRVHALASSIFKGAQQYYGARFGLGVPEMRVLSNLDSEGPLPASQLVTLTAMDKALVSRILSALSGRGYIVSTSGLTPRRHAWALSAAGRRLMARLRPIWRRREAIIQAGLSRSERDLMEILLERLFKASERLRAAEARQLKPQRGREVKPRARPRRVTGISERVSRRGAAAAR